MEIGWISWEIDEGVRVRTDFLSQRVSMIECLIAVKVIIGADYMSLVQGLVNRKEVHN